MASNEYPIDITHVKDGRARSGRAVLVDRVWPRGQRKDEAPWDEWLKTIAPSTELRKWYGHDRDKHEEFIRRYRAELEGEEQTKAFEHLQLLHHSDRLTLMTATKDLQLSQAQVLADLLARS
ncbi:hypothetical protein V1504DRAFT_71334 [Lipomyces starkeyi]